MAVNEKFVALGKDKAFTEKIKSITNPDQLKAAFASEGVDLDAEMKEIAAEIPDSAIVNGELNEEALETVAGGLWGIVFSGSILIYKGIVCLRQNLRSDGSMRTCTCGLHWYAVRR